MKCPKCQNDCQATAKFCWNCGHHFRMKRSENEIRTEFEKCKAYDSAGLTDLLGAMHVTLTLDWVLGGEQSPFEILTATNKQIKKRGLQI